MKTILNTILTNQFQKRFLFLLLLKKVRKDICMYLSKYLHVEDTCGHFAKLYIGFWNQIS